MYLINNNSFLLLSVYLIAYIGPHPPAITRPFGNVENELLYFNEKCSDVSQFSIRWPFIFWQTFLIELRVKKFPSIPNFLIGFSFFFKAKNRYQSLSGFFFASIAVIVIVCVFCYVF